MAVLKEHDFSHGIMNLWGFSDAELEAGFLEGVEIATGNEDADRALNQIPNEVWERLALQALVFKLAVEADTLKAALGSEMAEPGSVEWPEDSRLPFYKGRTGE